MSRKIKIMIAVVALMIIMGGQASAEEGISMRILPHSNEYQDQLAKRVVRMALDELLLANGAELENRESTRSFIQNNMEQIEQQVGHVLLLINYELNFEVTFGHHRFPRGYYESLVIRIGAGEGSNWWCFINPGVCVSREGDQDHTKHWQTSRQVTSNKQEAIQNRHFTSSFKGLIDRLFGSGSEATMTTQSGSINWHRFEDER